MGRNETLGSTAFTGDTTANVNAFWSCLQRVRSFAIDTSIVREFFIESKVSQDFPIPEAKILKNRYCPNKKKYFLKSIISLVLEQMRAGR